MKVAGIVAEYNPFHNGHQYHIEETKKQTGADYVIAVMSGDFVQRGAPAFLDKYDRTYAALAGGCDLVLELPVIYSSASAEFFAGGAVHLLNGMGVCDILSFGSEDGNLESLHLFASILTDEPEEYQKLLREQLKAGQAFPAAREKALTEYINIHKNQWNISDLSSFLKGSNNILGLEYLKALKKSGSKITPVTIMRKEAAYHDTELHDRISSASAIRHHIFKQRTVSAISDSVPEETFQTIHKAIDTQRGFPDYNHLTPYLHSAMLSGCEPEEYLDWDKDLANRMKQLPWATLSFTDIADQLKSRNVTHSRVHRALLHFILGIRQDVFTEQFVRNPVPYARILGFRKESSRLIKAINQNGSIPLITKPASIHNYLNPEDSWMWEKDLTASRLYQSILFQNWEFRLPSAYERSPIIL